MERLPAWAFVAWLLAISLWVGEPAALAIHPIARRWSASSRLEPSDAVKALYLEALGEAVAAADLFEAEKLLRSDGPVSPNQYVLDNLFTRLLQHRLGAVRQTSTLRTLPPVLHWLASQVVPDGVEVRGETLQLAVVEPSDGRLVLILRHRRLHHRWTECGGELCVSSVLEAPPSRVNYVWSGSPATTMSACNFRLSGGGALLDVSELLPDETYHVRCGLLTDPSASLRLTYIVGRSAAMAPSRASASAVVNNPLEISFFE